jgi:hypothetical protein
MQDLLQVPETMGDEVGQELQTRVVRQGDHLQDGSGFAGSHEEGERRAR